MRFLAATTLVFISVFAGGAAALADPADDINGAIKAFAAAQSVHVDVTNPAGTAAEDMVNPNKSRTSLSIMGRDIQIVKIGADRWINTNGRWRKSHATSANPIDSQIDMANSLVLGQKDVRQAYTVTDGGTAMVGSVAAHKYHLADINNRARSGDVFIGPGQLPLEIVINATGGSITFTYSQYNSIADISPPI